MSDMPNIDIRPDHWEIVRDILRKHVPQYEVWAFGSRAKWTAKAYSDLDLAVITDNPLPIQISANLSEAFSESDLPWKVDVVDWATTSESFRAVIERDKVVAQKRDESVGSSRVGTGRTGGREATSGVIPGRYALSVGCPDIKPPDGWTWTPLSSVAQLESGHTPSRKHPEYWDGDIPWIGIRDATENHGRTILDTHQHVTRLGLENSSARLLPANTVCLSRTASVGFVVVMGRPMATSQDFINWVCGPNIAPHYLKYVLLAENEALWRFASGTTHQTIYYPEAKALHVCLPPIDEQRAVSSILGSIDGLIESLRRENSSLQEMAFSLFKSRILDFGGTPKESMKMSEIGLIPSGWAVSTIGECFDLTMGQSPPGETYNEAGDGIPFYQGRTDFGWRFPAERVYCTAPTRQAKKGDVLVSVRAPVGDINVALSDCAIGRGVAAVRHEQTSFALYLLRSLQGEFRKFESEGTVFGSINKKQFESLSFVKPPDEIVKEYESIANPMDSRIENNEKQIRRLSALRNTLLPNLISGRTRVNTHMEVAGD